MVTELAMWLQYDYGDSPAVDGVRTVLFVAWLAWSRFRVVLPLRDKTVPSVFAALDQKFRRLGGVPTYVLTDNEKTDTTEHIAGIAGEEPAAGRGRRALLGDRAHLRAGRPGVQGRHRGVGEGHKADLVSKETNLREEYGSSAQLEEACEALCQKVNTRPHRLTKRPPAKMLAEERRLHPVAITPHTVAFDTTRVVPGNTPMVTFESGQYSSHIS